MKTPLLSVIVISHNQKELLYRCVNSILKQTLPFKYEIIISDDKSNDGTWETALSFSHQYPGLIIASQVNSDDCNPTCTSERSGHNRSNGYKLATGKYITHIDGDDYLRGTDSLKNQVQLLEEHPECSMAMQNIWIIDDGKSEETGYTWHEDHLYQTGRIVTAQEFFLTNMFILNQAFVMRRNPNVNPAEIYNKFYVDDIITFHHLQYGPIVCLDQADYVYVNYPHAITSSLLSTEKRVVWGLDLTIAASYYVPYFTGLYLAGAVDNLFYIIHSICRNQVVLSDSTKKSFAQYDAFIYQVQLRKRKVMDKLRLWITLFYLFILKITKTKSLALYCLLYKLLVHFNIDKNVNFKIK